LRGTRVRAREDGRGSEGDEQRRAKASVCHMSSSTRWGVVYRRLNYEILIYRNVAAIRTRASAREAA
jgi:hypothetical protein